MSGQKRVGLIGWPVVHSLSPGMHNAAFAALGMADEWSYEAYSIPPEILRQSLREFMQHGTIGLNVTLPFKQDVLRLLKPDPTAKAVGAANTLVFPRNSAHNTDVGGLMDDLRAHQAPLGEGVRAVVLGAGGAARAAVYGLAQRGVRLAVVNRTPDHTYAMLRDLNLFAEVMTPQQASQRPADLLINATPLGMWPHTDASPWPHDVPLPPGLSLVYDMVYRPATTALMQQAQAHGVRAVGGLGMLVRQGAASLTLWTGRDAPLDVMFDAAARALAAPQA